MIYNRRAANCNRQLSMEQWQTGERRATPPLSVCLGRINLFNYIDRQILAALEPDIRATFFAAGDVTRHDQDRSAG